MTTSTDCELEIESESELDLESELENDDMQKMQEAKVGQEGTGVGGPPTVQEGGKGDDAMELDGFDDMQID